MARIDDLIKRTRFLRQRINDLRIDFPEAADARRDELAAVEQEIATLKALAAREGDA